MSASLAARLRWLADEVEAGNPMMARIDVDKMTSEIRDTEDPNGPPAGFDIRSVVYTVVVELPPPLVP